MVYMTLVVYSLLFSYKTAHDDLLSALDTFNKEVAEEYTVQNALHSIRPHLRTLDNYYHSRTSLFCAPYLSRNDFIL